jgi:hypothetical protein
MVKMDSLMDLDHFNGVNGMYPNLKTGRLGLLKMPSNSMTVKSGGGMLDKIKSAVAGVSQNVH